MTKYPLCKCGHPKSKHKNGKGNCQAITDPKRGRVCECRKYRPVAGNAQ